MLGSKKDGSSKQGREAISSALNTIAKGTVITGEIESDGIIRIDGTIKGTVRSKSKIAVGKTGLVEGDIFCNEADIEGKVVGGVHVEQRLTIRSNGQVSGDIITDKLVVEAGAVFNGSCKMGAEAVKHDRAGKLESSSNPSLQKEAV
jgi:cytoskeletal protein CcmA (bactofilin family)